MQVLNMKRQVMGRRSTSPTSGVGEWLRNARTARGWTLEALADEAGTAAPVISNIERGKRNPSRDMVRKLGTALSTSPLTAGRLIDEGLIAAGFAPEGETYNVVKVESGIEPTETIAVTPEERAIIEQIRAMKLGTPSSPSAPEPVDTRTAGERAQGVPVDTRGDVFKPAYAPPSIKPNPLDEERIRERMRQEERERGKKA